MKVYKISKELEESDIATINALKDGDAISFMNTKGLSSKLISQIKSTLKIRVVGGLDETKKNKYKSYEYFERTLYSPHELSLIVSKFENIERKIDHSWNNLDKSLFIYRMLVQNMNYNYDYKQEHFDGRDKNRSLDGIVRGKSVCAGFSMIYKEIMDRLNIPCLYINKPHAHAWNAINIDNKWYPVDLTWDCCSKTLNHFASNPNFYKENGHEITEEEMPMDSNVIDSEILINSLSKMNKEKSETVNYLRTRADGSKYLIKEQKSIFDGIHVYIQSEYENNSFKEPRILYSEYPITEDKYVDQACSKYNIEHALSKNGYMGNNPTMIEFFRNNYKQQSFKRGDMEQTSFTLFPCQSRKVDGVSSYNYIDIRMIDGKPSVSCKVVHSENDLINVDETQKCIIANILLDKKRLDDKVENYGGYIGSMQLMNGSLKKVVDIATYERIISQNVAKAI